MRLLTIAATPLLLALVALAVPAAARAHPCEAEVAEATQKLASENQQILALELAGNSPVAKALRSEHTYRMQVLQQLQLQCAQSVRDERQGTSPAPAGGCQKDTDCKGARICVRGQCTDP
jgi:hypothetical protein